MRPAARLARTIPLAVILALTVAACATPPVVAPKRAASTTATVTPAAALTDDDSAFVRELLTGFPGTHDTTALENLSAARRTFPATLVPRDTIGRRLLAVVHSKARVSGVRSTQVLQLAYEGRLNVSEAVVTPRRTRHPFVPNATREETSVGGFRAEAEYAQGGDVKPRIAMVTWTKDSLRYSVTAPGMLKADAVRIARSMVPSTPGVPAADPFFAKALPSIATSAEAAEVRRATGQITGDAAERPYARSQLFPDDARTREAFEGALFPRETRDRALLAIVETRDRSARQAPEQKLLTLVYQRGLVVTQYRRLPGEADPPSVSGTETNAGGRVWEVSDILPSDGRPAGVVATREEPGWRYAVTGYGMSEADVLAVAGSLKP